MQRPFRDSTRSYIARRSNRLDKQQVIQNIGSKDISEITASEMKAVRKQMKNRKAPGEDKISKMLKSGGRTLEEALLVLLNKCLEEDRILET